MPSVIDKSSQHYKEFKVLLPRLIKGEGAYSDDKNDPGNWTGGVVGRGILKGTNHGISAMSYPQLDIKNLTLDDAEEIYWHDWYTKFDADKIPFAVVQQLWDTAINTGMTPAIQCLQRAVTVTPDGQMGPISFAALKKMELNDVLFKFNSERIEYYTSLSTFSRYGAGWMNRVAAQLRYCAQDN